MFDKLVTAIAAKVAAIVAQQLAAMLPLVVATVAKTVMDEIRRLLPNITGQPGLAGSGSQIIPHIDLAELTEQVRRRVSKALPDPVDLPYVADIFDTDTWMQQ